MMQLICCCDGAMNPFIVAPVAPDSESSEMLKKFEKDYSVAPSVQYQALKGLKLSCLLFYVNSCS
jgi:hypothetical protein